MIYLSVFIFLYLFMDILKSTEKDGYFPVLPQMEDGSICSFELIINRHLNLSYHLVSPLVEVNFFFCFFSFFFDHSKSSTCIYKVYDGQPEINSFR